MPRIKSAASTVAVLLILSAFVAPPAMATHYIGAHWQRHNTAIAQVYMVDHTPSFWPVTNATYEWNKASRIGVYYKWASCPSSDSHCVHVREYRDGTNDGYDSTCNAPFEVYGCALGVIPGNSEGHIRNGHGDGSQVRVWLNRARVGTAQFALMNTCHELGHAIGLGHREGTNAADSCMAQGTSPPNSTTPDSLDFDMLANIYDH